jgi:hypothetical protein
MSARTEVPEATLRSIEARGRARDTGKIQLWGCGCSLVRGTDWLLCSYHEGWADAEDDLLEGVATIVADMLAVILAWLEPESPEWTANVIEALRHTNLIAAAERGGPPLGAGR